MTVSVIVPVHKAEEWIDECLQSIYSQSYKDIDLIVIDDQEGEGAAAARNRGLAKAIGEYVMFVDADDYLEPGAIGTLVGAMSDDVDLVIGSYRKFGNFEMSMRHRTETLSLREVASYAMSNLRNPRDYQMLSPCWAKLYRRNLVGRFPLLTTAEDMAFNFDYLMRCHKVSFIERIVYSNRKHDRSLTTTFDESNKPGLFGFLGGLKYAQMFLAGFYPEDEINRAVDNSKVYHSLLYFMRICAQLGVSQREAFMKLYP